MVWGLVWVPSEANPEAETYVCVVYLGGDVRVGAGGGTCKEGGQWRVCLK